MSETEALLEKAQRALQEARHLMNGNFYEGCVSRAYYGMFYAAEAALLSEGVTASTHSGVHTMFGKHFIKTGVLPGRLAKHLGQVFEKRQSADYAAVEKAPGDAHEALEKAEGFLESIEAHLRTDSDQANGP